MKSADKVRKDLNNLQSKFDELDRLYELKPYKLSDRYLVKQISESFESKNDALTPEQKKQKQKVGDPVDRFNRALREMVDSRDGLEISKTKPHYINTINFIIRLSNADKQLHQEWLDFCSRNNIATNYELPNEDFTNLKDKPNDFTS